MGTKCCANCDSFITNDVTLPFKLTIRSKPKRTAVNKSKCSQMFVGQQLAFQKKFRVANSGPFGTCAHVRMVQGIPSNRIQYFRYKRFEMSSASSLQTFGALWSSRAHLRFRLG